MPPRQGRIPGTERPRPAAEDYEDAPAPAEDRGTGTLCDHSPGGWRTFRDGRWVCPFCGQPAPELPAPASSPATEPAPHRRKALPVRTTRRLSGQELRDAMARLSPRPSEEDLGSPAPSGETAPATVRVCGSCARWGKGAYRRGACDVDGHGRDTSESCRYWAPLPSGSAGERSE